MITEKERELGTRFAYINIVATLINFIFLAFVIGPDEIGYNESFGSLLGLVGLAQGLSFLGMLVCRTCIPGDLHSSDTGQV